MPRIVRIIPSISSIGIGDLGCFDTATLFRNSVPRQDYGQREHELRTAWSVNERGTNAQLQRQAAAALLFRPEIPGLAQLSEVSGNTADLDRSRTAVTTELT
jgi:hypothetical protein